MASTGLSNHLWRFVYRIAGHVKYAAKEVRAIAPGVLNGGGFFMGKASPEDEDERLETTHTRRTFGHSPQPV